MRYLITVLVALALVGCNDHDHKNVTVNHYHGDDAVEVVHDVEWVSTHVLTKRAGKSHVVKEVGTVRFESGDDGLVIHLTNTTDDEKSFLVSVTYTTVNNEEVTREVAVVADEGETVVLLENDSSVLEEGHGVELVDLSEVANG